MRFNHLKLFFSTICLAWFGCSINKAHSAQKVTVSTSRAIVYADKELTLPLGYVTMGKELRVGEVARKGGQVLPLIVSGKIAYIRVSDISFSKDNKKKGYSRYYQKDEGPIDFDSLHKLKDDLEKNNYLTTSYGFFDPGEGWHSLASQTGSLAKESIKTISLTLEHRNPVKKLNWGVGLKLYTLTQESIKTLSLNIEIPFYYRLYSLKNISFDGLAGLSITSSVKVKVLDTTGYYKGFQYGGLLGLRSRIPLTTKWDMFFTLSYKRLNISSMQPISIKGPPTKKYTINAFSGTHFTFGAGYRF
tara:strand:+ start:237 stop:1145 length:909 start_codon:yes stop_codon:yes gene_type:complete